MVPSIWLNTSLDLTRLPLWFKRIRLQWRRFCIPQAQPQGWVGKNPWRGEIYPLQYFGLENSMGYVVYGSQRVRHAWVTNTIYVCKNTDTIQFFIRQLTEFLLTMPCETLMKVNIKCPSKGLSLIPYNFINLNPSKDQIFQFISAIY